MDFILAEMTAGAIIGGGGLTVGGLGLYLTKRKLDKVCDHLDNQKIHVSESNGYVPKPLCDERNKSIMLELEEIKQTQHQILNAILK